VAVTQIRMSGSRGNIYYKTKIAEGKRHAKPSGASYDAWPTTSGA